MSDEPNPLYLKARRHLSRKDAVLKSLIRTVGTCTLRTNGGDPFATLARSIIAQQISAKSAMSIGAKVEQALAPHGLTVGGIVQATDAALRGAGLSAGKLKSLRDLATRVQGGTLRLAELPDLDDDAVIAQLVPVHGIGVWTAQMYLIFALGRLDVLPVADFGLRAGVRKQYGLPELPDKKKLEELTAPWQPYRSIGTWYIWKSLGPVPQSD